jgi:hypothetical protein
MMLNKVVFPDPLGPIRPVIEPAGTVSVQSSSACTPPKALPIPSVRSSALFRRARLGPVAGPGSPAADPLAQGGQHAARQEQDDQQEQHAQEDLAEVVVGELDRQPLLSRLQDQRAERGAEDRAHAAEEPHQRHRQVEQRVERGLRMGGPDEVVPQAAHQPGDQR